MPKPWSRVRNKARVRLMRWANCLRIIYLRGAPNPDCYHRQLFMDERVDHDMLRRWIEQDERFVDAIRTDNVLQALRDESQNAYDAVIVRYLERVPGTSILLDPPDQVRVWHHRTGLGKSQYYARLEQAECRVGFDS